MAQSIPEMYGSLVFNDKVMRSKLPKDMYKALKKTIETGTHLENKNVKNKGGGQVVGQPPFLKL